MKFGVTSSINSNSSAFRKVLNIHTSYKLNTWSRDLNTAFILGNCLFGAATLAKNIDLDEYVYSDYGIGFDTRSKLSLPDGRWRKNIILFEVDKNTTVTAEAKYPVPFTQS